MDLFAYGVLMDAELLYSLTGRRFRTEPAILDGYQRYTVAKEGYPKIPAIVQEGGAAVGGALVREVDEESFKILDEFEEVETGLYVKQWVSVRDEAGRTWRASAYVGGPEVLGSLTGAWDPAKFFERYYEEYRTRIIPRFLGER